MAHDPTKVLLGNVQTSSKEITEHAGSPATFLAGLAVRQSSSGLSLSSGRWLGVSLGKNLSDSTNTVAIARDGLKVPILLEAKPARGTVTISNYANLVVSAGDTVTVGATGFVAQSSAVTPGQATFRAATDNDTTAASLASQINAHATAGALVKATVSGAVVTLTAKLNTTAGNAIALTYTDANSEIGASVSGSGFLAGGGDAADYVAIGSKVYISDTTGKADDPNSAATISDAIYVSGVLTGIQEDGTEAACAIIDMQGGL